MILHIWFDSKMIAITSAAFPIGCGRGFYEPTKVLRENIAEVRTKIGRLVMTWHELYSRYNTGLKSINPGLCG